MNAAVVHGERYPAVAHLLAGLTGIDHSRAVLGVDVVDHAVLVGGGEGAVGASEGVGTEVDDFLLDLETLFLFELDRSN